MFFNRTGRWFRWPTLAASAATLVLGLCLLIWPHASLALAVRLCGAVALVSGCALIARYVARPQGTEYFQQDLTNGVFCLLAAAVLLFGTNFVIGIVPVVAGLLIAVEGLLGIQEAMAWRRSGWPQQRLQWTLSLCTLVLGLIILFWPVSTAETVVSLLGAGLVISGATQLWHSQYARRFVR